MHRGEPLPESVSRPRYENRERRRQGGSPAERTGSEEARQPELQGRAAQGTAAQRPHQTPAQGPPGDISQTVVDAFVGRNDTGTRKEPRERMSGNRARDSQARTASGATSHWTQTVAPDKMAATQTPQEIARQTSGIYPHLQKEIGAKIHAEMQKTLQRS